MSKTVDCSDVLEVVRAFEREPIQVGGFVGVRGGPVGHTRMARATLRDVALDLNISEKRARMLLHDLIESEQIVWDGIDYRVAGG